MLNLCFRSLPVSRYVKGGRDGTLGITWCFGSFQGDKKDMQVQNISFIGAKNNDISGDLNTVAFTAPLLLNLRAREGGS